MPLPCGPTGFQDGGMITNATVSSSTVQGSIINGSAMVASSVEQLTKIDSDSARKIADAIAALPLPELKMLAKAIADATPVLEPTLGPEHGVCEALPTDVAGGRRFLLGEPVGWLATRGVVVPAYTPAVPGNVPPPGFPPPPRPWHKPKP